MGIMVKQKHGGALNMLQKGESGNPNGRPKKNYTQIIDELKAKGYKMPTKGEYFEMIGMLLIMEEKDLEEYAKDKARPYWIRLIIIDLQNKNTRGRLMSDYRDWLYGKAEQKTDITSGGRPLSSLLLELDGKKE